LDGAPSFLSSSLPCPNTSAPRLNLLGQVAGVASTEFGLAQMIFAAVSLSTGGEFVAKAWQTYLLFIGLLIIHGLLNVRLSPSSSPFTSRLTHVFYLSPSVPRFSPK
jgi:hypothetical protein